eukprot:gene3538-4041_t
MSSCEAKLALFPSLPSIGLGTFKIKDELLVDSTLQTALTVGYLLIDTASVYKNERFIGRSLQRIMKELKIEREEIFITSKLAPKDQGYEKAKASCLKSLQDLNCNYIDLYLIHWPGTSKLKVDDMRNQEFRQHSWRALEELKNEGLIRHIGVSNYTVAHLQEMKTYATIQPAVNQVEFHPHLYQEELLDYCTRNGICVQAYSSLGCGILVGDPVIKAIAKQYCKSESQILLKWALQHGLGVIPKSTNPKHIAENFQLKDFQISNKDMEKINALNINKRYCWDPSAVV